MTDCTEEYELARKQAKEREAASRKLGLENARAMAKVAKQMRMRW